MKKLDPFIGGLELNHVHMGTLQDFMLTEARRGFSLTGIVIPTGDSESFIKGSADAGLLRILK